MAEIFITPNKIISGSGALVTAGDVMIEMGSRVFLVTDHTMEKLGNLDKVTLLLDQISISYTIYAEIDREPDDEMIEKGAALYMASNCDFLMALGGGSPIDSMKAIAMLAANGGAIADYLGQTVTQKLPPMVAIPTTSGTGSEATQFTIITDMKTQVKMLLKGPTLMPDLAIIDPQFTMTAPPKITASTGIDALTHAIEAYTSQKAQPLSDTFAVSACRRIFENLRGVWEDGSDEVRRNQMSLAALEAGIAFNNSSVTLVHGMSRPIGALFHVPHGISNAMLLNVCLDYAANGALDRFAELSKACGLAGDSDSSEVAVHKILEQVKELLRDIQIPTLEEYGIDQKEFFKVISKMAEDAFASGSPSNTRREITIETMEMLYKRLW